jgi:RimJ/RimL family protein N-acetyltransferase
VWSEPLTYTWCGGPAGTSYLFAALAHAGVDEVADHQVTDLRARCLHSLLTSGIPQRLRPLSGKTSRTTEIGYWLGPWARGVGVMRGAVTQLAFWAFREQRFELRVATGNVPSRRVAEACGFARAGVLRKAGYVHAGRVHLIVCSLVPGDLREPPD